MSRRAQTLAICSIRGFCAIYPLMACSALPLEIAENDLTHCYYLAVHCRKDGEIRVATEEVPSGDCYRCPVCQPYAIRAFSAKAAHSGSSRFGRPRKRKRQSVLIDTSLDFIPKCKTYLFNRPFDLDEIPCGARR